MRTKQFYHVFLASVMLAATAGLMTSCATEDNPGKPTGPSESVVKEKIVGKWKAVMQDGKERVTNRHAIMTFFADGTMTYTRSYYSDYWGIQIWANRAPYTYTVSDNLVTREGLEENGQMRKTFYEVNSIGNSEMEMALTGYVLDGQNYPIKQTNKYKHVTADYSEDIIGLWEATETTGEQTYNDDNARLAFLTDGTYKYYRKSEAGEWQLVSTRDVEEYFVDGDFVATRWQEKGGEMNYEWWDIDEIKDGQMKWSALREREDGTRFTTTFTWRKVSNLPALTIKVGDAEVNMMKVKGGDYSMAINRDGTEMKASGTTADFYIAQTEVTNKLWKAVMGSVPTELEQKGDEYPIALNSYNYLVKEGGFLDKLNEMTRDQLPAGKKFALPTEVEWHYAAMGGQQSKGYKYAGSNTIGDVAWYLDNCNSSTQPVSQKEPNELGIYDMSGNVWEFTSTLADGKVITCGGGWTSEANWCEVNLSFPDDPDTRFNNTGLRLVVK
mgnify:CR=1 FL=1